MRGCLVSIAVLVTVGLVAGSTLLPRIVSAVAEGALGLAGFSGTNTTVQVIANPPPKLLTLTADALRIHSTNASFRGIQAGEVSLTLHDVHLLDRRSGTLNGTLRDVRFGSAGGARLEIANVELSGTATDARATLTLSSTEVGQLVGTALRTAVGSSPSQITLAAPDRLRAVVGGATVTVRLRVRADGALVLVTPAGPGTSALPLIVPGPATPFRILSFQIVGDSLVLVAGFDPTTG